MFNTNALPVICCAFVLSHVYTINQQSLHSFTRTTCIEQQHVCQYVCVYTYIRLKTAGVCLTNTKTTIMWSNNLTILNSFGSEIMHACIHTPTNKQFISSVLNSTIWPTTYTYVHRCMYVCMYACECDGVFIIDFNLYKLH